MSSDKVSLGARARVHFPRLFDFYLAIRPSWTMLRGLGRSRVVRSSYIWLILVPLSAKLVSKISKPIEVYWYEYTISIDIPFSWKVFFFASVAFAAATALFSMGCPAIIRNYESLADFLRLSRSGNELIRSMSRNYALVDSRPVNGMRFWTFVARFAELPGVGRIQDPHEVAAAVGSAPDPHDEYELYGDVLSNGFIHEGELPEAFDVARDAVKYANPKALWTAYVFYVVGLLLFGFVVFENVAYVVQYSWEK